MKVKHKCALKLFINDRFHKLACKSRKQGIRTRTSSKGRYFRKLFPKIGLAFGDLSSETISEDTYLCWKTLAFQMRNSFRLFKSFNSIFALHGITRVDSIKHEICFLTCI